jgi:hypothetical protein
MATALSIPSATQTSYKPLVSPSCGDMNGMSAIIGRFKDIDWFNDSIYDDNGCPLITREAQWGILRNGVEIWNSGWTPPAGAVALGTASTGAALHTLGGIFQNIVTLAAALPNPIVVTNQDNLVLTLQVRSLCAQKQSDVVRILVNQGLDLIAMAAEPPVDSKPGVVYDSDTLALEDGVALYKWYRASNGNVYGSSYNMQLRQLIDP